MRKRLALFLFFLLAFSSFFTTSSLAQEKTQAIESKDAGVSAPDVILPPPDPRPGFLGQDHSYTVVFRGNGEGVVSLKVVLTNKEDSDLSEVSLRIPKVEPKNLAVYQVIREKRCIRYLPGISRECAQYQEPDYYSYWGQSKYQRAEYEYSGDTLTIALPKPIKTDNSGSFFVYYRAFGYAKKNVLGAYKYTFESLKVYDDIRSLRVGISTDSDLVLKGAKGEVQYRFDEVAVGALGKAGLAAPEASAAFDRFYSQIGQGRVTKTASNLASYESYTVDGSYATSRLKLYAKEIVIVVAVIIVFFTFFGIGTKFVLKRLKTGGGSQDQKKTKTTSVSENVRLAFISAGVGFSFSLLIVGYTALVIFGVSLLSSLIRYNLQAIFVVFIVIISFAVYAVLLFGPAIYLGAKKGIGWGIATVVSTVLWLIVFSAMALLIVFLLGTSLYSGPVLPLLESVQR